LTCVCSMQMDSGLGFLDGHERLFWLLIFGVVRDDDKVSWALPLVRSSAPVYAAV